MVEVFLSPEGVKSTCFILGAYGAHKIDQSSLSLVGGTMMITLIVRTCIHSRCANMRRYRRRLEDFGLHSSIIGSENNNTKIILLSWHKITCL